MCAWNGNEHSCKIICAAMLCLALQPGPGRAEGIDTEHIYAFMIGTDVGDLGEREFQSETTGRFSKQAGAYQAIGQQFELEFVPIKNFRIEVGTTLAAHNIDSVPDFVDRTQVNWQGASLDLRYRFLDRETAPFGLTLALESHGNRIDETTARPRAKLRNRTDTGARTRGDSEPSAVATLNLGYQPEWTRFAERPDRGAGVHARGRVRRHGDKCGRDFLFGGEVRYFRKYDGIGLDELAGQALFVGPTAYFQLSERARLTANWSVQAWGRPAGIERHARSRQFRTPARRKLVFGVNF